MSRRAVTGGPVTAGARLGAGGQAEVFAVAEDPTLAYKRYHRRHASAEAHQKLLVMTAHVPTDPARPQGHASIAWPLDVVVSDSGAFEGFVMPRVDTSVAVPLFHFYNPAARQVAAPSLTWRYLLRLGANLASALDAVHRAGYVVGDLNESNALGTGTALVTLVDCDSVQVRDPTTGRVFYSPVGKPDYLAPELQGTDLATVERIAASDDFSLAILLHLLLMEGAHPFMGVWKGPGEPPGVPERMRKGMFPPANSQLLGPAPIAMPFATLPPELQRLFLRAFGAGINDPAARPSAAEWQDGLVAAEAGLVTCSTRPSHVYSGHLSDCPWCRRVAAGFDDDYDRSASGQRPLPGVPLGAGRPSGSLRPQSQHGASASPNPRRTPAPAPFRSRRPLAVIAILAVVAVAAVALAYLTFFNDDAPERLALSDQPATTTAGAPGTTAAPANNADLTGTWRVAAGSVAGYRVREKLAELPAKSDAVGRSEAVTGSVKVDRAGASLTATDASFEVDLTKLTSNESRRDNRIRTDGLQTNRFPKATFVSTGPITLPPEVVTGQAVKATAVGDLTLHGVTKRVTIPLDVRVTGGKGELVGSLGFPMSDFNITPPNVGGFVTVDPDATLEFKLLLEKA